jgi:16S rRNA processing protein RimM
MSLTERSVRAGDVGRAHGLDGSFYLVDPAAPLAVGVTVRIGELETVVDQLRGTAERLIVRVRGVDSREAARALAGRPLLVAPGALEPDEYLAADLVGCSVAGVGTVRRVVSGPSCDVLEVGDDAVLIPFVRDAIRRVDLEAATIDVDLDFLDLR